jgi:hypothetical protein
MPIQVQEYGSTSSLSLSTISSVVTRCAADDGGLAALWEQFEAASYRVLFTGAGERAQLGGGCQW